MAEIEHFLNPEDKSHKKFYKIKSTVLPLFPADHQMGDGKIINISDIFFFNVIFLLFFSLI